MQRGWVVFLLCLLIFPCSVFAQKSYWVASGETILSYGQVGTDSTSIKPVVRFSPVFNLQQQHHFNFSNHIGFYTGLGIRNVGLISHVNYSLFDAGSGNMINKEVTIKERSYSLGLPVALKFGDLDKETYFAMGGEAELMFAYKRKIIDGDTKRKSFGWFDDRDNIFNPSLFVEIKFATGQYVRFKYYLLDFLNYKGITLIDGTTFSDYGRKSPLFYVSFGTMKMEQTKNKNATPAKKTTIAYFKSSRKKDFHPAQMSNSFSSSVQ